MDKEYKIFIIRQCYDDLSIKQKLYDEIVNEGIIRQGWGWSWSDLRPNGNIIDEEKWVELYLNSCKIDDESEKAKKVVEIRKRYSILQRMLDCENNDIVIVPKQPDNNHFIIAKVCTGYSFGDAIGQNGDFRHTINIDKKSIREVAYYSCAESVLIKQSMRAYQSAVNRVLSNEIHVAIEKLLNMDKDDINKPLTIQEIIQNQTKGKIDNISEMIKKELTKIPPIDLEKIVEMIFTHYKYEFIRRNKYDKEGGDIDLILTKKIDLPIIDMIEDLESETNLITINIQVKQKVGSASNDKDWIKQILKISNPKDINIIATTADGFTDECKIIAKENNVILLNGMQLSKLILQTINSTL